MAALGADKSLHRSLLSDPCVFAGHETKAAKGFVVPTTWARGGYLHVFGAGFVHNVRWSFSRGYLHDVNYLGFHRIAAFRTNITLLGCPHVTSAFFAKLHSIQYLLVAGRRVVSTLDDYS